MAQRLVMSLTLVVLPMLLLVFFQIGFLPYHSEPITWWHRGMLLVDVGVVAVLALYPSRRDRETKVGFRLCRPNWIVVSVLVFFSHLPWRSAAGDTEWDPLDHWMASLTILSEPVPLCRPEMVTLGRTEKRR